MKYTKLELIEEILLQESEDCDELAEKIYRISSMYEDIPQEKKWAQTITEVMKTACIQKSNLKDLKKVFADKAEMNPPSESNDIMSYEIFKALEKGCEI